MRATTTLAALALVGLVAAGCSATSSTDDGAPLTPGTTAAPEASAQVPDTVVPTRVVVRSIGSDSTLQAVGLNSDHTLQTPPVSDPGQAAWYRLSPIPGNTGPSVILGHINGDGHPGVFVHLADLKPGAEVDIDRSDGTTAVFSVSKVELMPKNDFRTSEVYGDVGNAQLRLVSCGGALDSSAHSYEDNVVAFADLVGAHRT